MIIITAGHHDKDSGAISPKWGKEADHTKLFRDTLAFYLRREGVEFWVDNDQWTLGQVIWRGKRVAAQHEKVIAIDWHFNASGSSQANGCEVVVDDYANNETKAIAEKLSWTISNVLKIRNRGVKTERDTYRKKLGYLDTTNVSLVAEIGFISNDGDMEAFNNRYWLLAKAVSELLINYIQVDV